MRIFGAFAALVGGAVGIGWLVTGALGALIAGALALLASVSLYRYAARCVLQLAGAYPISRDVAPGLHGLVDHLAAQAGTPTQKARNSAGAAPRLCWLPGAAPNVLATGRDPAHAAIALSSSLLDLLDRDELTSILARELARVANGDTLGGDVAAVLASGLMLITRWPDRFWRAAESGEQDSYRWARGIAAWIGTALRMVLGPLAAGVVRAASSAERVHAADAAGAQILGDPLPLARALAKLAAGNSTRPSCYVNPGLAHQFVVAPSIEEPLQRLFCTHPPVAARVRRLTEQALEPTVIWTREVPGHRKAEIRGVQSEYRKSTGTM